MDKVTKTQGLKEKTAEESWLWGHQDIQVELSFSQLPFCLCPREKLLHTKRTPTNPPPTSYHHSADGKLGGNFCHAALTALQGLGASGADMELNSVLLKVSPRGRQPACRDPGGQE